MSIVIFTQGLRKQLFQQLAFLLALADAIQTSTTVLGNVHEHDYTMCCLQLYILQFGILFKTSLLMFVGGLVLHIVWYLCTPKTPYVLLSICMGIPLVCISASIAFGTADVYCTSNFDYHYASSGGRTSYVAFLCVFFAPLYLQFMILLVCVIAVKIKLSHMRITTASVELVLHRLMLYPVVFIATLIPSTLFIVFEYLLGHPLLIMELLTAFCVSINGFIVGSVYIRYQKKFPPGIRNVLRMLCGWCLLDEASLLEDPPLLAGSSVSSVTFSGDGSQSQSSVYVWDSTASSSCGDVALLSAEGGAGV